MRFSPGTVDAPSPRPIIARATASAAIAYSLGYRDGEALSFAEMLEALKAGEIDQPTFDRVAKTRSPKQPPWNTPLGGAVGVHGRILAPREPRCAPRPGALGPPELHLPPGRITGRPPPPRPRSG